MAAKKGDGGGAVHVASVLRERRELPGGTVSVWEPVAAGGAARTLTLTAQSTAGLVERIEAWQRASELQLRDLDVPHACWGEPLTAREITQTLAANHEMPDGDGFHFPLAGAAKEAFDGWRTRRLRTQHSAANWAVTVRLLCLAARRALDTGNVAQAFELGRLLGYAQASAQFEPQRHKAHGADIAGSNSEALRALIVDAVARLVEGGLSYAAAYERLETDSAFQARVRALLGYGLTARAIKERFQRAMVRQ